MSTIDDVRSLLEARIGELDGEQKRLSAALKELDGTSVAKRPGRPRKAVAAAAGAGPSKEVGKKRKGAGKKRRRRRKGGSRLDQAVALVEERPGISAGDIAKALEIKPNYLYRVMNEAVADKRVLKSGRAYLPAAASV